MNNEWKLVTDYSSLIADAFLNVQMSDTTGDDRITNVGINFKS